MAHQSGFGGALILRLSTGPDVFSAIAVKPSDSATYTNVRNWSVTQRTDTAEAYGKGEAWTTTFQHSSEWEGTFEVLMPSAVGTANAAQMLVGQSTYDISFYANGTWASGLPSNADYLRGSGWLTRFDVEDPLDGPVVARLTFVGSGTPIWSTYP